MTTTSLQNQTLSNKTTVNFTGYTPTAPNKQKRKLIHYILAETAKDKIPKFHIMQDDLNTIHHDK